MASFSIQEQEHIHPLYSECYFPELLVQKIKTIDIFRIFILWLARFSSFFPCCSVRNSFGEETVTVDNKENPYLFTSGYTRG